MKRSDHVITECAKAAQSAVSGPGFWDKIPASQKMWRAAAIAVLETADRLAEEKPS